MGQASSTSLPADAPSAHAHAQRERARQHSSTIWRQDSIQQHVEQNVRRPSPVSPLPPRRHTAPLSTPGSRPAHCASTAPAHFSHPTANAHQDSMITQTSLVRFPRDRELHDLALFLRTTGPAAPHRQPSSIEHPRRGKQALRLLRFGGQKHHHPRHPAPIQTPHARLDEIVSNHSGDRPIPDAARLLAGITQPVPDGCEQKVSSAGKRYLALKPRETTHTVAGARDVDHPMVDYQPSILRPDILESRVSVCFHDDVASATGDVLRTYGGQDFDLWLSELEEKQDAHGSNTISTHSSTASTAVDPARPTMPASSHREVACRFNRHRNNPTPVRPAASDPPSPIPESAPSKAGSYRSDAIERPPSKMCFDTTRALTSHPISPIQEAFTHAPAISLPHEEFPVKHPSPGKEIEIRHPFPRRLASHPVLLQRPSSVASSTMYQRSVSDSLNHPDNPGPPPPKSPLRLRRDHRALENVASCHENTRRSTPKIAPSIKSSSDFNCDVESMRAVVTTECTGPMSRRPKSRGDAKQRVAQPAASYLAHRREREERVRVRKLRDRPSAVNRTIDSIVHAPATATRQRLQKPRPQITIPHLRPAPSRAPSAASRSSVASSSGSWQKAVSHSTSPVYPVPARTSEASAQGQNGTTPISPIASVEARAAQAGLGFSPTTLAAEERPVPKTKSLPKPAKAIVTELRSKSYAPRPRSASLPRNAFKQRRLSRNSNSIHSSPKPSSPVLKRREDEPPPPLPSPPPTRALPPTPPASGSEKPKTGAKRSQPLQNEGLPLVPSHPHSSMSTTCLRKNHKALPHIATQRKTTSSSSTSRHSEHAHQRTSTRAASRIDARLEALEKQNALLSAALMAVLKTNGSIQASMAGLPDPWAPDSSNGKGPMAWETRIARRSAATTATTVSHTASSSDGSALEMYMSTMSGSRHGTAAKEN